MEIVYVPSSGMAVPSDKEEEFRELLDQLDENDDIQRYYHNAE